MLVRIMTYFDKLISLYYYSAKLENGMTRPRPVYTNIRILIEMLRSFRDINFTVEDCRKLISGAIQLPNLVASKCKCLRGLDTS